MERPIPDDKSWTWVLDRPCDQCGYDTTTVDRNELAARVRSAAAAWRGVLGRNEDLVRQRPPVPAGEPPVWSALEYGAHVRDVFQLFRERLGRMLSEDDPRLDNWDQDRAAIDGDYAHQEPGRVGYALAAAAGKVADILDRVGGAQWDRPATRSDGDRFTIESISRYLLHDVEHHLVDASRGFQAIIGSAEKAGNAGPDGDDGEGSDRW